MNKQDSLTLLSVIKQDCELWETLNNHDKLFHETMRIVHYKDSEETGLYGLYLNDGELWYGTLSEINAVVKSMCNRLIYNDYLN